MSDEELVVSRILGVRRKEVGGWEYKLKWKGYDDAEATWYTAYMRHVVRARVHIVACEPTQAHILKGARGNVIQPAPGRLQQAMYARTFAKFWVT